jgi:hypothetical protein
LASQLTAQGVDLLLARTDLDQLVRPFARVDAMDGGIVARLRIVQAWREIAWSCSRRRLRSSVTLAFARSDLATSRLADVWAISGPRAVHGFIETRLEIGNLTLGLLELGLILVVFRRTMMSPSRT